jgi:hypothetical protein
MDMAASVDVASLRTVQIVRLMRTRRITKISAESEPRAPEGVHEDVRRLAICQQAGSGGADL